MSEHEYIHFVPLETGDVHDDDAQVFDDYTADNPEGPEAITYPQEYSQQVTAAPERENTLRAVTQAFDSTWAPWQVLPRDSARQKLIIEVHTAVAGDRIRIAGTSDETRSYMTCALLASGVHDLGDYKGAVWTYATDAAGAVIISVIAITE